MANETTPLVTPPASAATSAAVALRKNRLAIGFAAAVVLFLATAGSLWSVSHKEDAPQLIDDAFFCGVKNFETEYVKLTNKKDDHYFYWFVQSSSTEPDKDPLVLWLTGGPGGPGTLGLLLENGPCIIQPDSTGKFNKYAWTNEANVIWLDQPTNVGFSYGSAEDADSTGENVGENIYWFLQGFLANHPEFAEREFFITGESYGGHYVPAAAHFIWQQNKLQKKENKKINLKGIAIGNGLTDPAVQNPHYMDMVNNAYNITFVNASQLAEMKVAAAECERLMAAAGTNTAQLVDAESYCQDHVNAPIDAAKRNPYDIRESCDKEQVNECIPTDHIGKYLERPHVREFLNVSDKANKWQMVNFDVNTDFFLSGDTELSYSPYVADLLNDDIRVLIYAGDADLACNWYGNQAWTKALEWTGKEGFNSAEERAFITSAGVNAGVVRSFDNQFTFLRVFNSGHMVPQHQPEVALDMINKFFKNQPL